MPGVNYVGGRTYLIVAEQVEAMVPLVLADHLLRQQGQCSLW